MYNTYNNIIIMYVEYVQEHYNNVRIIRIITLQ